MSVATPLHPVTATETVLDHERLDVYRVAVALDGCVVHLGRRAGRGHGWLVDQAQRASGSTVLNLAEALGRQGADRARALRIARGSALELDAALTLLAHRGACPEAARAQTRALNVRVVSMLTRLLAVSQESPPEPRPAAPRSPRSGRSACSSAGR